jgi:hypothetical protein
LTLKDGTEIILPADFELDGASIPRIFWGILSPVGLLLIPGLIHDYTEVLGGRGASPQLRERQRDEFAGNL